MALPPSIKKITTNAGKTRYRVRFRWRVPSNEPGKKSDQNELNKTFDYLGEAKNWLIEQQQKHMQGKRKPDTTLVWLYENYYDTFKEQHLRPSSRYTWGQVKKHFVLKYFGEDLTVSDITSEKYQRAIDAYGKKVSHTSVKMAHQRLKEVFSYAVDEGYITSNPTTRIKLGGKPSQEVEYLSVDEAKKLLKYISEHKFRNRDGISKPVGTPYLIAGLLLTGCRESELAGLTWDRVSADDCCFKIDRQWRTCSSQNGGHSFAPLKTKSSYRTVSVPESFIDTILSIKLPGDKFVFNSRSACFPPSETSISRFLSRILSDCDIHKKGFHVHSLRHSHVALLLDSGVDIYAISKRLGHASFSTTLNTYAYIIDESKKRADDKTIKALNNLL